MSFLPTQVGYIPTGNGNTQTTSTVYLGRNVSIAWEAGGLGANGRPDYLETLYIFLSDASSQKSPGKVATLTLDVADVQSIITSHSNARAAALTFKLREVDVCDAGVAKKMMILASDTYSTT